MDFTFSDDQLLFRDAVRDLLANECSPDAVRTAWESPDGRVPGLWAKLAEMGVVGLTAPESAGGLGMSQLDLVLLHEEAGKVALPEPLGDHTAVALATLADIAPDHELVAQAAAGEATIAVGFGDLSAVLGASAADALLLQSGDALHLIDPGDAQIEPFTSVDESRRMASVSFSPSDSTRISDDADVVSRAYDCGVLAAAATCIGLAQQMLDMTVEYVAEREQFGKPVGVNQAVKHHCSNMGLAIEFARPLVYQAAWSLSTDSVGRGEQSRDVSAAKVLASDAADLAARLSLQCHGAIGYTVEYDLQLWLKRAWALSAAWGSAAFHRTRVADALL